MKTTRKILSILMIFVVIATMPLMALASTKTVSPLTGLTYTHADKFDGKTIHHGIDVSEHNCNHGMNVAIDWTTVKKTIDFAIIRAGYRGYGASGALVKDQCFDHNIKEAKANKLKVGIYFYSQALNTTEAKAEANKALEILGKNKIDLPIFYDYEFAGVSSGRLDSAWKNGTITKKMMTNNAIAFMDTVKKAGYTAMLYCNPDFLEGGKIDANTIKQKGYGVWLAHYTTKTYYSGDYTAWQYSSTGKIDGIKGNVDSNFWYGSFNQTQPTTTTTVNTKVFTIDTIPDQQYTGKSIQPSITVKCGTKTLTAGSDYYISYANNSSIGTATATVTGINNYSGYAKKSIKFNIVPKKVSGLELTDVDTSSAKINWKAESTAKKYRVQVYRNGAWKTYADTSDNSITVSGLTSACKYSIRVAGCKAVDGKEYVGPYSTAVKLTTIPAKPNLKISSTNTTATLSWQKQSFAKGYKIYKYDYTNKKFKLLKEVTNGAATTFKHSNLKKNYKYKYRVRAYTIDQNGKRIYGAYSDSVLTYTTPSATTLYELSAPSEKTISTSWSKVAGASGYQVQWSTSSNFSYNYKSVYLNGGSTTSTRLYTVQSKAVYYVRVRAYSTHYGKNYYSEWSNTNYITTK